MSPSYPYQARALMRFKAQDGQFVLGNNQLVTVTGQTDDEGDWLDVTNEEGGSGSVPAGFLIEVEPAEAHQEAHQEIQQPPQPIPVPVPAAVPQVPSPDPPKPPSDPVESVKTPAQPHPVDIPAPIAKPSSNDPITPKPISDSSPNVQTTPPTSKTSSLVPAASDDLQSSQSSLTPSKAPPTPTAKPNTLRDRIAMFNKSGPAASSPPPAIRPKPPIARKPMNIPPPAPPIDAARDTPPSSTTATNQDDSARSTEQTGMSAADAEESVKAGGSLKDRIRLLQQQQQQQQQATTGEPASTVPKPKREWKRPVAAPSDEPNPLAANLPSAQQEASSPGEKIADPDSEAVPIATDVDTAVTGDEADEAARRRKIAERMAKLGGAKMGFGLPGPGLPPKPSLPQQSSEGSIQTADEPPVEEFSAVAPERIVMPTIPKRAAPPRRKAPAPSKSPAALETPLVDQPKPPTTPDDQAAPVQEDSLPQEKDHGELLPVDDSSALATEPSINVPQSSDTHHPEPSDRSTEDVSVQSQENTVAEQLPDDSGQSVEDVSVSSEKDPLEEDSALDHQVHRQDDPSNAHTQVAREDITTSHPSIEPDLPTQVPLEHVQPGEPSSHQATTEDVGSGRPSLDREAQSTEEDPHTSGLSSLKQVKEYPVSSTPHQTNASLDHEEPLHESMTNHVSSPRPPSPTRSDEPEEHSQAQPPPVPARSDSFANSATGPRTRTPSLNSEAEPHVTDVQPDSRPLSAEPVSCAPTAPASVSHGADSDVEGEIPAPYSPNAESARIEVPADPTPAEETIKEVELPNEASDKAAAKYAPGGDEDEEVARRQRIAERLAKMGGRSMMSGATPRRPLPEPPVARTTPIAHEQNSDAVDASEQQPEVITDHNQSESLPVDDTEEEDDEAARRRRIAERMAKMGGRSMMGGMMPMFSQQSSGGAANATRNAPTAHNSTSPAQPTRALPPTAPTQEKSNSTDSYSSPPSRAAPVPTIPDLTDKSEDSPPIPPNRPRNSSTSHVEREGTSPARSPATMSPHRPRIPNAYNSPQRASSLSKGSLAQSADEPLPNPADDYNETTHNAPYENTELLSRTPPKRHIPQLPTASPVISDEGAVAAQHNLGEHGELGSDTGVDPTLDEEHMYEEPPEDLESEETGHPVPIHHQLSRMDSFKARDLDIASERWWRSRPVVPPASVTSLDDVLIRLQGTPSLTKGITISQYELIVIRDDYSKTIINVKFGDNPEDESLTELTQKHYPPPEPYEISKLQSISHSLGPQIVSRAKAKEDEKGFKGVEGSSFVKTIVQSLGNALEPVGSTFGQVIYHCNVIHDAKGSQPEIHVHDDIRPGDILASYGASFKGKGIGHNSMNLGSLINPHLGVISENDIKKNKLKAFGVHNGKVELMSYRLDELKSGSIVVYRVLDKAYLD
ncbi:hypothetical protein MJO28_017820 [Puccinia striiformis f. sp. tritici]|nr:hypothetical protein MJO28_017820 [Puccinia striiformis f. sp. tritici]